VASLSDGWYRKLLSVALVLGLGAGAAALLFTAATGLGIDLIFGDPRSDPWSGEWWWIPVVSGGAVLVALMRRSWKVPQKVPTAVGFARQGWVDPSSALSLFVISTVSLFVGASLGPSFAIIVAGGGMGAWFANRLKAHDDEGRHEYALTGMASGLGAIFSAPLFASVMASELSPTQKKDYVAAFIPQLIGATVGYVVFFGITGKVMLDAFAVPGYAYENVHLLYGAALGVLSVLVLLIQALVGNGLRRVVTFVPNPLIRAAAAGAAVGAIAFALPLTATGGSSQLAYETANIADLSIGLLALVLVGKMAAFTLSQEAGFLGGPVFPIIFIGGTAGILVHLILPSIPAALAVAAMVAAVPGATIGAPVSFILLGAGVVGLGIQGIAPVGIAVVTAHLAMSSFTLFKETRASV
jgi:H+/Cl- antiporter ClcA